MRIGRQWGARSSEASLGMPPLQVPKSRTFRKIESASAEIDPRDPAPRPEGGKSARADGSCRSNARSAMFAVADALAAGLAVGIAGGTVGTALAFAGAAVVVDLLDRRRSQQLGTAVLDDVPALAARGIIIAGVGAVFGLAVHGDRTLDVRHGFGVLFTMVLFVTIAVILRAIGYAALRRLQASGRLASPGLIIGAGSVGARIGNRLAEHPEFGVVPVGYVDSARNCTADLPAPLLGDVEDLPKLIARHGVHHVFVAFSGTRDDAMVNPLRGCDRMHCEIFVVPRLFELGVGGSSPGDHLWGVPLVRLHRAAFRSHTWTLKRVFDVVISGIGLILAAPLLLAIALAVRLEGGPGVLFRQVRVGLDGRPFELVKFRTMRPAAADEPMTWSEVSAERVGPVGRFLRRSSLDELPQLWNILRGQMSLVGPRPEVPEYVREFAREYPQYEERLRVPAGLTGLAQVHDLRGATPIEDRVSIDNFYIEHWSLWRDVKILVRTVASVLRMRGH